MSRRGPLSCSARRSKRATLSESAQCRSSNTTTLGDRCGQVADDLESDAHALVGRPFDVGEQLEALVGDPAGVERVEEQLERAAERPGVGLARVHRHPLGEPIDQLPHESGLADTRLAADQCDRRRLAGVHQGARRSSSSARPTIWVESPGRPTSIRRA